MTKIEKYLVENNISYTIKKDLIVIDLKRNNEWVNGFNETMTEKATIRIFKLPNYYYHNYSIQYNYEYGRCKGSDAKTYKDVITEIEKIISTEVQGGM